MHSPALLSTLLLFLHLLQTSRSTSLSFSPDNGQTWYPVPPPATLPLPPSLILSTLPDNAAPKLSLPRCALQGHLKVSVITARKGGRALGLRVESASGCDHNANRVGAGKVVVKEVVAKGIRPHWMEHLVKLEVGDGGSEDGDAIKGEKKQGFFGKYGLYIMLFIGVALAQGIRTGLAELREEMEREESGITRESRPVGQVKVVVPKKKSSARQRKKGGTSAS